MDDRKDVVKGIRGEAGFGATGESIPGMPLRVVVLSELTGRDLRTGKSEAKRRKYRVDRQSFDEMMKTIGVRAMLDVPDRLGGGNKPLILELAFENMKSFRPEAIAAQIPGTRDLLKLRQALVDLRANRVRLADVEKTLSSLETRSLVVESVRRALQAPTEAPGSAPVPSGSSGAPAASGNLDAILGMVDTSSAPTATGADLGRLDALVRHLVSSQRSGDRVDGKAVDAAVREIDAAIAQQIDEVLHHPEMRRLEAAWRGLRLLTDRTDFEHPVHIDVISAGREEMVPIYDELIHTPESQGLSSEPVSMIVVDQIFDKTPEEIDLLSALAERGAALSAPVLTAVGAPFLGLSRPAELARTSGLAARFKGPEFVKWNGLRESGASRWLGVVFNRMLLRPAHAPAEKDASSYAHVESIPSAADEIRAWGNPVWALATLCTRSFARIGWCTDIMGQRAAGTVEDLPLRLYERPGAENASFPLEAIITDEVERDLSNNGTMTLSAALNGDKAFLRFAPTVHTPQHYQDPSDKARARLQSTLPFQMFVGRLINYAMMIEGSMVPGRGADQIAAGYDRALRGLLATAGPVPPDAVAVAVPPNEADPSRHDLHLKVRWPGFQSLPGAGDLELRWPLMG